MKASLRQQFERLALRLGELEASLSDQASAADLARFRSLAREHAEVQAVVAAFRQYEKLEQDAAAARSILERSTDDPEMIELAREEIASSEEAARTLLQSLQASLLPREPDDDRNVFIEIRAGAGGDESTLFAADIARMYLRHAERKGWQTEVISESLSDLGGYKEAVIRVASTDGVYRHLKFESGGHRVQRVPVTEAQGRIHTSACTVAVLPEIDEAEEVPLNPAELRIDTFRASGAGGQHVNKTDSAIRITHLPTGLVAECQDDRSQHRNKAKALAVLAARVRDKARVELESRQAAQRKGLIGSGDRSDRIRTYNFPQGRLTDHRINLTLYKLQSILDGDLDDVIAALQAASAAEQLALLESGQP